MNTFACSTSRGFRALTGILAAMLAVSSATGVASAESTGDAMTFANTESFQTIDAGDGNTPIELLFGETGNRKLFYDITSSQFKFTQPLLIQGNLTATGSLSVKRGMSGATLRVDGDADIWGNIGGSGALKIGGTTTLNGATTVNAAVKVRGNLSGSSLTVDGGAAINGSLSVSNSVSTTQNLTINSDNDTNDAVLTFGNQSAAQTIKFLNGTQKFQFSNGISVVGNISGSTLNVDGTSTFNGLATHNASVKVRGNLSGSTLNVDGTSTFNGVATHNGNVKVRGSLSGSTLTADQLRNCNSIDTDANGNLICGTDDAGISQGAADTRYLNADGDTMAGDLKVRGSLSGSTLTVDGNAGINGTVTANGSITTNSNSLTINGTNNSSNDTLTFGNQTAAQTLTYSNANQRFEFSKDVQVTGGIRATGAISGSTLNVDGTINWHGQSYTGPTSQAVNGFLKTDGAGNLTWSTISIGNSSGAILAIRPAYPNAIYFASGATSIGKLKGKQDTATGQNYYHWTTTKVGPDMNDYWTAVQVQVPMNFSHFDGASPLTLKLRTSTTSAADNYVTIRMKDTAGNMVPLTSNTQLTSAVANAWRTATIGGVSSGTFTPGSDITIYIKTAATSSGFTDLGSITLNWTTTTP